MKSLAKLKDEARRHEAREEWEQAIDAYVQVLRAVESGGDFETELPLYNRIGDLYVRLGAPVDAVSYYERAADLYADAGLYNNAIALCNKALRYMPSRLELIRKLGQFSAAQGFITDARRWYLEYAESQLRQGELDDAFRALEDFAQVHEDAEIRELLGRYLVAHNRGSQAIAALTRARELHAQAGDKTAADRLTQIIQSLDPSAPPAPASAPPAVNTDPFPIGHEPLGSPVPVPEAEPEPEPEPEPEWEPVPVTDLSLSPNEPLVIEPMGALLDEEPFNIDDVSLELPSYGTGLPDPTAMDALPGEYEGDDSTAGIETGMVDIDTFDGPPPGLSVADLSPVGGDLSDLMARGSTDIHSFLDDFSNSPPNNDVEDYRPLPGLDEPDALVMETPPGLDEPEAEPLPYLDMEPAGEEASFEGGDLPFLDLDEPADAAPVALNNRQSSTFEFTDEAEEPEAYDEEAAEDYFEETAPIEDLQSEPAAPGPAEPETPARPVSPEPAVFSANASPAAPSSQVRRAEPAPAQRPEVPRAEPPVPARSADPAQLRPRAEPPTPARLTVSAPPRRAEPAAPPVRPADPQIEWRRALDLVKTGDKAAAKQVLEQLHPRLAASGSWRDAWTAADTLSQLEPSNSRFLQLRVEYASASGDRELLLRSYVELARQLARSGAETKAKVIYQRVLELAPDNNEAHTALYGPTLAQSGSRYVDLSALVSEEEERAQSTRFVIAEKPPTGDEERDFADMLSQFRQKVAEHVSLGDSGAHYDLGLAFKEMGLIDEAISEFQVALKGGEERLKVYEELGQCFLLKQQYTVAVTVLSRALTLPVRDDADLLGVYYALARAYQELGRTNEAKGAYERVVGLDINFRDAAERLAAL